MALKPDEIETLIHLNCHQGKAIGRFVSKSSGKTVPAFGMTCKVSIIDYKSLTTIAQKTFEDNVMEEETSSIDEEDKKYVNNPPLDKIQKYLEDFSKS